METGMSVIDFATLQVYRMDDLLEVVFPFDKELSGFMKSMKGRWAPQRKCWQIKPAFARRSADEIIFAIEEKLQEHAPKRWPEILEVMKDHGCVSSKFEIFAGKGGVRLKMPAGHPCHYYLKEVPNAQNTRNEWQIPARDFSHDAVQKSLARLYKDDEKAVREQLEPVEERGLVGELTLGDDQLEAFGMSKSAEIAALPSFLEVADPAMGRVPLREIGFEVVKMDRRGDDRLKVRLEYLEPDRAYALLKTRVFDQNKTRALESVHAHEDWAQKRF